MWISGISLAITGVAGDVWQWWSDWPFLTNLLSSISGALIGIPVALFIIQQLAMIQAESMVSRRERATAAALVLRLRINIERVVPGIFADFGFMHEYRRAVERAIGLLCEIRESMAEGRNIGPELTTRLADAMSKHREFSNTFFNIERIPSETRGIWQALRPYLISSFLDASPTDYLHMAAVVDAGLESVSRASNVDYRQVEEIWSNTMPGEKEVLGKFTLNLRGVDQRLDVLDRLAKYLETLQHLYADLDGITARLTFKPDGANLRTRQQDS